MIKYQKFNIVNKNGDTLLSFMGYHEALVEFSKNNPNYVKIVQVQHIERVIKERKLDKNGNAV